MKRIAFALAAPLALAACEDRPLPVSPYSPPPPAKAASAPVRADGTRDLGGGYRDAKWGMGIAQVEQLLGPAEKRGADPQDPARELLVFHRKDDKGAATKKELVLSFLEGQLYRAALIPHLADADASGFANLKAALEQKFGSAPVLRTGEAPLEVHAWDDGTTRIELSVGRLPAEAAVQKGLADPRVFGTTSVVYTSLAHAKKLEAAKGAAAPAPPPATAAAPATK